MYSSTHSVDALATYSLMTTSPGLGGLAARAGETVDRSIKMTVNKAGNNKRFLDMGIS